MFRPPADWRSRSAEAKRKELVDSMNIYRPNQMPESCCCHPSCPQYCPVPGPTGTAGSNGSHRACGPSWPGGPAGSYRPYRTCRTSGSHWAPGPPGHPRSSRLCRAHRTHGCLRLYTTHAYYGAGSIQRRHARWSTVAASPRGHSGHLDERRKNAACIICLIHRLRVAIPHIHCYNEC